MSVQNKKFAVCSGLLLFIGAMMAAVNPAHAAPISWGAAQSIVGDMDVRTNGALVAAYNFNGADTSVNGVNFLSFPAQVVDGNGDPSAGAGSFTVGDVTLASSFFGASPDTSAVVPPFTGLTSAYQTLLGTAAPAIANMSLTLGGLIVGQLYAFQVWSNNSSDDFHYGVTAGDTGFVHEVFLSSGSGDIVPDGYDLGQYVIGTFVADAVSQQVFFRPDEVAHINGFQLRAIAPSSVPEPGVLSLALLGLAGLMWGRYRSVGP